MSRSGAPAGFANDEVRPLFAVELEFDSGTLKFWNGYQRITINGDEYIGCRITAVDFDNRREQ